MQTQEPETARLGFQRAVRHSGPASGCVPVRLQKGAGNWRLAESWGSGCWSRTTGALDQALCREQPGASPSRRVPAWLSAASESMDSAKRSPLTSLPHTAAGLTCAAASVEPKDPGDGAQALPAMRAPEGTAKRPAALGRVAPGPLPSSGLGWPG